MRFLVRTGVLPALFMALMIAEAQEESASSIWPQYSKPAETDQTSMKLIELNLKARGGRAAIESVQSIRFTGILTEGRKEFDFSSLHAKPARMRIEKTWSHRGWDHLLVQGSADGTSWSQVLLPEKKSSKRIRGTEGQLIDLHARLPFLFVEEDAQAVYMYRGKQRYAGRHAHLIHAWLSSGLRIDIHLDAATFHIINIRQPWRFGGREVLVDCTPVAMKRVDGVWWPTAWRFHLRNGNFRKLTIDRMETNLDHDPEDFSMPKSSEIWLRPNS